MKMDIVESDLKQLFMWIKNLDERVSNIEHDLALVLSVIKDRKDGT